MNLLVKEPIELRELFNLNGVSLSVLRLDQVHPIVSGNKIFKLHYFVEKALRSDHKTLVSFGGAYSNHLVATAYACQSMGLKSIGIVRGELAPLLSHTLQHCKAYGMQLIFVSRAAYHQKEEDFFLAAIQDQLPTDYILIPEGGYDPLGAQGASLIMTHLKGQTFSHIGTAMGTATTLAGLLLAAEKDTQIIGVSVLKGDDDTESRLQYLIGRMPDSKQLQLLKGYHFGGYGKKNNELLAFMNQIWLEYALPLDFVYTGKLFYAVIEKIKEGFFPIGSKILCLHTGGLQGNDSLTVGSLNF